MPSDAETERDNDAGRGESPRASAGKGRPVAAWIVIIGLCAWIIFLQSRPKPVPEIQAGGGRLQKALFEVQAKYLVGAAEMAGRETDQIGRQIEGWHGDTDWQRVRLAVLAGELIGPQAALGRLHEMQSQLSQEGNPAPTVDRQLVATLIELYDGYEADRPASESLSDPQRQRLRQELGWFGKLALSRPGHPSEDRQEALAAAHKLVAVAIGGLVAFGLLGLIGVFVLIVVLALLLTGSLDGSRWRPRFGGVYAETFAVWLALYFGFSILGEVLFPPDAMAAGALFTQLGSLLALLWPAVRGVAWQQVRQDIGWTRGRGLAREMLAGLGCYAMAIPLALLGLIVTAILAGLLGSTGGQQASQVGGAPINPVAELLVGAGWLERLGWLVVACVVAPLVEETMFRGVLYRHLREASAKMRAAASALLSALVVSFLFAVVHPQGLLAAPAIMGLAFAFALMREWRGTLIPSMLAHATNNAVVMLILLALVGS